MVGSNVWQLRYIRRAEQGDLHGWTVGFRVAGGPGVGAKRDRNRGLGHGKLSR
jgi:hypothetical protein